MKIGIVRKLQIPSMLLALLFVFVLGASFLIGRNLDRVEVETAGMKELRDGIATAGGAVVNTTTNYEIALLFNDLSHGAGDPAKLKSLLNQSIANTRQDIQRLSGMSHEPVGAGSW